MKNLLKEIHSSYLQISKHAKVQMELRGYSNQDLEFFFSNELRIVNKGKGYNHQAAKILPTYTLEGFDSDQKPLAVVLSKAPELFTIVTVMPPTDQKRFTRLIYKRGVHQ